MVEPLNSLDIDGWVSCHAFHSLVYTGFTLKIATFGHL
jgi:hypothetical protein